MTKPTTVPEDPPSCPHCGLMVGVCDSYPHCFGAEANRDPEASMKDNEEQWPENRLKRLVESGQLDYEVLDEIFRNLMDLGRDVSEHFDCCDPDAVEDLDNRGAHYFGAHQPYGDDRIKIERFSVGWEIVKAALCGDTNWQSAIKKQIADEKEAECKAEKRRQEAAKKRHAQQTEKREREELARLQQKYGDQA